MGKIRFLFILALLLVTGGSLFGQTPDSRRGCSANANKLVDEAFIAQPLMVPKNNANPAKAESLYKQALIDSPKCLRAGRLLTSLLLRREKYEEATEYNEKFLQEYPDDPALLSGKADLVSFWKKDYQLALEIETKLLQAPDFNNNGNVYYKIARIYSLMNKRDDSLRYLELAMSVDKGWGDKSNAQTDSGFKNLRKDKRFRSLVSQK